MSETDMIARLFPSLSADERGLMALGPPWDALRHLEARLSDRVPRGVHVGEGVVLDGVSIDSGQVWIEEGAVIEPTAVLTGGPIFIGRGAQVRTGAYLRGPLYLGEEAIAGHATEVKGSIFFCGAKAPHFAYVGDSILGAHCNLGAGTKLANLRLDGRAVWVTWDGARIDTGLHKLGALIGEGAQVGCNAVLNPGTLLLPGSQVPPCTAVKGTVLPPR